MRSFLSRLFDSVTPATVPPLAGGLMMGTLSLLLSIVLINTTFPAMGQAVLSASYVCLVIGCYGIATPVTWYCLRQNRRLRESLIALGDLHNELMYRASHDAMTGLLNREAFLIAASDATDSGGRYSLLFADIDHFKKINDTWGHEAGDQAIKRVAEVIRLAIGDHACAGRIGGEEFAVLLTSDAVMQATRIANDIRQAVEQLQFFPAEIARHELSISVGGAHAWQGASVSDVLRMADRNLYQAKDAGRNRVMFAA